MARTSKFTLGRTAEGIPPARAWQAPGPWQGQIGVKSLQYPGSNQTWLAGTSSSPSSSSWTYNLLNGPWCHGKVIELLRRNFPARHVWIWISSFSLLHIHIYIYTYTYIYICVVTKDWRLSQTWVQMQHKNQGFKQEIEIVPTKMWISGRKRTCTNEDKWW